jgi:hypothetical protein
MIASILCCDISRRAFSIRARRSSLVIGVARSRMEVSAAMDGGSGAAWANAGDTRPATSAAAEDQKKLRRVNMAPP